MLQDGWTPSRQDSGKADQAEVSCKLEGKEGRMLDSNLPEAADLRIEARISRKVRMARLYVTSYCKSLIDRKLFQDVRTYCLFIGHARSGHSIVGALLDAHPNIILPDELDVLRYVTTGFTKNQIYHLSLMRSQAQARKGRTKAGRNGRLYSYRVPGQWQGRFSKLQVIGNSRAGITTQRLAESPSLLERLRDTLMDTNVRFVHVVRNPYDNISTLTLRGGRTFENAIERYFANCETIADIQKRVEPFDRFLVKQEEFLASPQVYLSDICRFLGVETTDEYLTACASILYKSPAKSRFEVPWDSTLIELVKHKMEKYPFLAGYSYQN